LMICCEVTSRLSNSCVLVFFFSVAQAWFHQEHSHLLNELNSNVISSQLLISYLVTK
jgi:hypothetical protein